MAAKLLIPNTRSLVDVASACTSSPFAEASHGHNQVSMADGSFAPRPQAYVTKRSDATTSVTLRGRDTGGKRDRRGGALGRGSAEGKKMTST